MRKLFSCAIFCLISIFLLCSTAFANNTSNAQQTEKLSPELVRQYKEGFSKIGISVDVQDKLIKKIQNGETLDCLDPQKRAAAKQYLKVTKDNPRAEYTFDDGSKIIRANCKMLKN